VLRCTSLWLQWLLPSLSSLWGREVLDVYLKMIDLVQR
jgi:hypothetical protein